MADDDDFDQHFGGDEAETPDGDAQEGDAGGDGAEGAEGGDEEDFSKDWGDLPDDPVNFGGGGGVGKKVLRISLMVLIGFGVPATTVGVLYATGLWESLTESSSSDSDTDSVAEDDSKKKKKKRRSRKGKKKARKAKRAANGGGDAALTQVVQDWDIETGNVVVTIKGKAELWVDGVSLGKVKKKKKLQLEAGTHLFRAKMGKKKLAVQGAVEAGGNFTLLLDFKKKKAVFEAKKGRKKKR